ncbi:TPA: AlpA family transcriptional regulator [Klebsiella pneumoniae]|nr:AlpA family transcriptional regulator [Klebsiella pneumoniae]HEE0500338.1 AlpA family transcriptional regulator [Klebsiella pneumoniae]
MKCGATVVAWKWCEVSNMVDIEMIDEEEAMRMIRVSSRVTIRKYTERYNFPKPVRTYPKQYLRSAIVEWILNGGINQKSS